MLRQLVLCAASALSSSAAIIIDFEVPPPTPDLQTAWAEYGVTVLDGYLSSHGLQSTQSAFPLEINFDRSLWYLKVNYYIPPYGGGGIMAAMTPTRSLFVDLLQESLPELCNPDMPWVTCYDPAEAVYGSQRFIMWHITSLKVWRMIPVNYEEGIFVRSIEFRYNPEPATFAYAFLALAMLGYARFRAQTTKALFSRIASPVAPLSNPSLHRGQRR